MKIVYRSFLCLMSAFQLGAMSNNTMMWRSFSSYISRNMFFDATTANILNEKKVFSVTFDYMQSFGSQRTANLGATPFWSGSHILTVGNNDGDADFDAYQLGLGDVKRDSDGNTILGSVEFCPKVQHVGADMILYFKKSEQEPGWYFKLSAPLGAMLVQSNFREVDPIQLENNLGWQQVTDAPSSTTINYQFPRYPTPDGRCASFTDAFAGGSRDTSLLDGNSLDLVALKKGRMISCRQEVIRLADVAASFGYNFLQREKGYFGAGVKVSGPTGNVPHADYIFEPIFGRAGMWALGGELKGQYELWNNQEDTYIDMLVQAEVLHVRSGRNYQYRSFDLKQNGAGSKYLLVQHYPADYGRSSGPDYEAFEMHGPGTIQPAVNITTLPVLSKFSVEGSIAAMVNIHHNSWRVGLVGEFWGRSRETLSIDTQAAIDLRLPDLNEFAVLGRQLSKYQIDGQAAAVSTYYCEPLAKIHESQDSVSLVGTPPTVTKPSSSALPEGIADARLSENRIPRKLEDALDICGAQAPSVMNGRIVAHVGYVFEDRKYVPAFGLQLGVEFSENKIGALPTMWNVGCKGSIEF